MKKLILASICASMLVLSGAATAQEKHSLGNMPPKHELKMHENLAQKLNLTDEQKAQADKIREEGRKKMEPLMQEKKTLHEKMDKLRKENMEEFEKILTPEQKETFAKFKEEHRAPHKKMKKGRFGSKHKEGKDLMPKSEEVKSEAKK